LSASYARHFVASEGPNTETCNAILRIKDTNNTTVSTFERNGNFYATNSININPTGDLSNTQTIINSVGVHCNIRK
jgi:hypothetical protein